MNTPTTFIEATDMHLEVTFFNSAANAEAHAANLTAHGREVVAIFEEVLTQATKPLHLVCVKRNKANVGPLGLERKR